MSKILSKIACAVALLSLPLVASADIFSIIDEGISIFSLLTFLFISLAIVVFFWGIVKFIWNAGDQKTIDEGKKMIVWGLVGILVIVGIWGIVGFIQETLGIGTSGGGTTIGIPYKL